MDRPRNDDSQKGFVDRILREVLQRSKNAGSPFAENHGHKPVSPDRPNYQRQKNQQRLAGELGSGDKKTVPPPAALFAADPARDGTGERMTLPAVALPAGTLTGLSMRAGVPAKEALPAAKVLSTGGTGANPEKIIPVAGKTKTPPALGQAQLIGVADGQTVGYVIPNMDRQLRRQLAEDHWPQAVGVISSRRGAAAHIMAADEAVKKTGAVLLRLDLSRDDGGGPGHGAMLLLASPDVADVTKAVEITLAAVNEQQQNIYHTAAGKIEVHYSARSASVLEAAFGVAPDQAVGILIGAPAGVGLLMSDNAVKSAKVEVIAFRPPSPEQAFANETWLVIAGEPAAVRNALDSGRQTGEAVLAQME